MKKFILIIFFLFVVSGCIFVDQSITLTYSPINAAKGGYGDLFIAKPVDRLTNKKKNNGLIIGTVKSGHGMKTADVVTNDNVSDWVTMAYMTELGYAGYNVKAVHSFPENLTKGIQITLNELFVDQDTGLTSIGAITNLKFSIDVYKHNNKISTINVAAKGDSRSMQIEAKSKGLSLKKALESAMRQSIPEIIKTLK